MEMAPGYVLDGLTRFYLGGSCRCPWAFFMLKKIHAVGHLRIAGCNIQKIVSVECKSEAANYK